MLQLLASEGVGFYDSALFFAQLLVSLLVLL